jgi:hypothetical protein
MDHFFADLWELAKTAGPFGTILMLYLWALANSERKDCQKNYNDLQKEMLERTINGLNNTANSVREIGDIFSKIRERDEKRR